MKKSQEISSKQKQYIILDTNVFQHAAKPELGEAIGQNIMEAIRAGYGLAISDFTFFELLDGASPKKEVERMNAIGKMKRFWVKKEVLIAAAHLSSMFSEDGYTIKDIGDKVIGATSVLTNSIIYTVNGRDYPRPFFDEIVTRWLEYSDNGIEKRMKAYFIRPDIQHIVNCHSTRMKPILSKTISEKSSKESD